MLVYPILCIEPGCTKPAQYKIASLWSDGVGTDLKTYSLCCADCLSAAFGRSLQRQACCRLAPGESLEIPGIYDLVRGQRDRQLLRRLDLEALEQKR